MKRTILILAFAITLARAAMSQITPLPSPFYTGITVGAKNVPAKAVITKITRSGNEVSIYSGATLLSIVNPDTTAFELVGILKRDSVYQKPGSYATRYSLKNEYVGSSLSKILKSIGTPYKVYDIIPASYTQAYTMVDNRVYGKLLYIPDTTTLTGMSYFLNVAATGYTGDQNNGFALYKWTATTITKVAETANSPTMWTQASGSTYNIPFTAPYIALPGYYYAFVNCNWSAASTAPQLSMQIVSDFILANSTSGLTLGVFFTAQNSFPATYNVSALKTSSQGAILSFLPY